MKNQKSSQGTGSQGTGSQETGSQGTGGQETGRQESSRQRISWRNILMLQIVVFVYSMISMMSKQVSSLIAAHGIFSWQTICGVGCVFLALGVYAFFWQKILKRVDLSVAYSNKAVGLLWTLLWSSLMFGETITVGNVVGLVIICAGVLVVTGNE